jgi:hypothetical protein
VKCSQCNREIQSIEIFWQKVSGWEKRREAGGTNHIALRQQHEEFTCAPCMTLIQSGLSPSQTRII